MWLKVGPKEATHALYRITDVIRRCDIDSIPAEALADDPPLLIDEIVVAKFVIDLAL